MATTSATSATSPQELCSKEARADLIRTAIETIQYVGFGSVMKERLMEKYNLPANHVEYALAVLVDDLGRAIKKL